MKRIVYVFTLTCLSLSLQAQDINKLMSDLSMLPDVEDVVIPELSSTMIQMDSDEKELTNVVSKVKSIRCVTFSNCSEEVKETFIDVISRMKIRDYELLLKKKIEDTDLLILTKSEDEQISEFVIISVGLENPVILQMKGEFTYDDLPGITKGFGEKKELDI